MSKFVVRTTKNIYEVEAKNKKDAESQVRAKIRDASIAGNIFVKVKEIAAVANEIIPLFGTDISTQDKSYIKQRIDLLKSDIDNISKLSAKL